MTLLSAPLSESLILCMKMCILYGGTSPNELLEIQIKNKRSTRAGTGPRGVCVLADDHSGRWEALDRVIHLARGDHLPERRTYFVMLRRKHGRDPYHRVITVGAATGRFQPYCGISGATICAFACSQYYLDREPHHYMPCSSPLTCSCCTISLQSLCAINSCLDFLGLR